MFRALLKSIYLLTDAVFPLKTKNAHAQSIFYIVRVTSTRSTGKKGWLRKTMLYTWAKYGNGYDFR